MWTTSRHYIVDPQNNPSAIVIISYKWKKWVSQRGLAFRQLVTRCGDLNPVLLTPKPRLEISLRPPALALSQTNSDITSWFHFSLADPDGHQDCFLNVDKICLLSCPVLFLSVFCWAFVQMKYSLGLHKNWTVCHHAHLREPASCPWLKEVEFVSEALMCLSSLGVWVCFLWDRGGLCSPSTPFISYFARTWL